MQFQSVSYLRRHAEYPRAAIQRSVTVSSHCWTAWLQWSCIRGLPSAPRRVTSGSVPDTVECGGCVCAEPFMSAGGSRSARIQPETELPSISGARRTEIDMAQRIEAVLERGVPWSSRAAWWLVTLEGLAALVIGLAIVLHPGTTRDVIVRIVGVYLVAAGFLGLIGDWRGSRENEDTRASLLRHIVMVVVGGAAIVDPKLHELLAWGPDVAGIVGLISILAFRNIGESPLG